MLSGIKLKLFSSFEAYRMLILVQLLKVKLRIVIHTFNNIWDIYLFYFFHSFPISFVILVCWNSILCCELAVNLKDRVIVEYGIDYW